MRVATRPGYAPRTVLRPPRRAVETAPARRRSHAAIPVALVVVAVGLVLASYSLVLAALLGVLLLGVAGSFLSARINPFSVGFYLTVKPSWTAIGVVALGAVVLFAAVYLAWIHGTGDVVPGVRVPRP